MSEETKEAAKPEAKSEATLIDLVRSLPKDPLSDAVRAKVDGMNKVMHKLFTEHKELQAQLRDSKMATMKSEAAKKSLHKEKVRLRKAAEEQLESIKANVEALQQSKREAEQKSRTPTHHTVVWHFEGGILYRTFKDYVEACSFYHAIRETEKLITQAGVVHEEGIDDGMVDVYLQRQRREVEERMKALGIEPEVLIPEQVEQTLRDVRQWMTYRLQDTDHPAPSAMINLLDRVNDMLIDDEDERDEPSDWKEADAAVRHATDMVGDDENYRSKEDIDAWLNELDDDDNQAANEERYRVEVEALANEEL
jgi:hypothetical protein